ncbi:MAG: PAS domain S-box protein [Methanomicrobiales archaeon]|nr:PAS domain S-box protein [Methanomicrobiales archaeon]
MRIPPENRNPVPGTAPDSAEQNTGTCLKTKDSLKESEERFRKIFEASPIGIALVAPDLRFFAVNPAWIAMTGYSEEELLTLTVRDITHPDYLAGDLEHIKNLINGTLSVYSTEKQYIRKDKSTLWGLLRVTTIRDENGTFRYLAAQIEDITARKMADDALRESEARLRLFIETTRDSVVLVDEDGLVIEWNAGSERITGIRKEAALGRKIWDITREMVPPEHRDERHLAIIEQVIRSSLATGTPVFDKPRIIESVRSDGSRVITSQVIFPMKTRNGFRFGSISRDITGEMQAEKALRESEIRFREQYQNNPLAIFTWQHQKDDFVLVDCNTAADILTEGRSRDYLGKKASDLFAARGDLLPRIRQCYNDHKPVSMDFASEHFLPKKTVHVTAAYISPDLIMVHMEDITERKRAEGALAETNRRLTTLIANLQGMVYRCKNDPGWTMEYASEGCAAITGYSPEDIMDNKTVAYGDLIHPDDRKYVRDGVKAAVADHLPFQLRYRIIARDTTIHWVGELGRGVFSMDGTLLCLEGYIADITAWQNAEDALKKTYDILNETQAFSHLGGWDYDVASERIQWTDEVYRIHGIDRDFDPAAVSRDLEFYTPESRAVLEEAFHACIEQGRPYDIEADLIRADGNKIRVRTMGRPVCVEGKVVRVHGNIMDISERWQAGEALRHKTALLEAQLQSSRDGILIVDPGGKKILENMRVAELWKIPAHITEDPDDARQVRHVMEMTRDPEQFLAKVRYLYDHPHESSDDVVELTDGTVLERYSAPIFGGDGTHYGRIWVFNDVTERRNAEATREKLIAELAQKNVELDRFTYTVSHDLKSPLIGIRAFLTLLDDDLKKGNTTNAAKDIRMISESAEKLESLISTLLALSRSGKTVSTPLPVSLHEVVQSALALLGPRLHECGITVTESDHYPVVMGDRERLQQVMTNLIDNAIKFMGGQPHPSVEVGVLHEPGGPVFFVRDNGMGIRSEDLPRVFGLYERFNPDIPGTGIGLATVKRIIEAHGGKIWVESEGMGKGSTFWFTLSGTPKNPE